MGIKEIAELAGVSKTTVSLALNGRKGVSLETRLRILEIAKQMDYRVPGDRSYPLPHQKKIIFARLRKHGLILNEDQNSFIMDYIDGMNLMFQGSGYTFEIFDQHLESIDKFITEMQEKQPEGLIILGTELEVQDAHALTALPIPFVVIDTFFEQVTIDFVDMANIGALHTIVEHLVTMGHQDIGMVTSTVKSGNIVLRERGFKLALDHFSLPYNSSNCVEVGPGFEGAYRDTKKKLTQLNTPLPHALFCYNDVAAFGVIKALKEHGYRVPDDISIVGFDDLPMSAMMEPHLTTVKIPNRQISNIAASLLINQLNTKNAHYPSSTLVNGTLIIRDSVSMRT